MSSQGVCVFLSLGMESAKQGLSPFRSSQTCRALAPLGKGDPRIGSRLKRGPGREKT